MNILTFRLSSFGDIALSVPVIMNVLENNPEVKIKMVTPKFMIPVFPKHDRLSFIAFDKKHKHKGINGLWLLYKEIKKHKIDSIADIHGVLRTHALNLLLNMKTARIDKGRKEKKLLVKRGFTKSKLLQHTTERYADTFRKLGLTVNLNHELTNFYGNENTEKTFIGIAPFAKHQSKMYEIDKMLEIVKKLSESGQKIQVFGSMNELMEINHWKSIPNLNLVFSNGLKDEIKIFQKLKVMISMDSANMHLASLAGVPVISIWGATHHFAGFMGYGQDDKLIIEDIKATWRPSSIYGNIHGPKKNMNGMKNISTDIVFDKIMSFIN